MKKFLFILSLLLVWNCTSAQVLNNYTVDLPAGQEIFDMTYVPNLGEYMIVGNFISVNGQSRNKVAFLGSIPLSV